MIIYNELDGLIAEAMKAKDEARLSTFRMIKTKFMSIEQVMELRRLMRILRFKSLERW